LDPQRAGEQLVGHVKESLLAAVRDRLDQPGRFSTRFKYCGSTPGPPTINAA